MVGYMYILECCDGSYYVGSTIHLEVRVVEHQEGKGANHTRKRLPVKLVYVEEYRRIDTAFYREKQIQGGRREKKRALIEGRLEDLPALAECKNKTNYKYYREREYFFDDLNKASAAISHQDLNFIGVATYSYLNTRG